MRDSSDVDPARAAVASAIQRLAAARLGRGFVPLGLVSLFGVVQIFVHGPLVGDYLLLALGAPVAAGAMLAYGLRAVRRALGAGPSAWMTATGVAGLLPWLFGMYVLGLRGLRPLGGLGRTFDPMTLLASLVFIGLGLRILWIHSKLGELQRLAVTMVSAAPEEDEAAT